MGFRHVTITHGTLEHGRDLVFAETDKLGREIWRAIQAKATSVSGSLSSPDGLRAVLRQCEAALDTEWTTAAGAKIRIREVWLVTTGAVSEQAKASVAGMKSVLEVVHIIDGPSLVDLVKQFLPDLLRSESKPIDDYLISLARHSDSLEPYIAMRLNSRALLSDFFVPPHVAVEFPAIDPTTYLGELVDRLGLSTFVADAVKYLHLSRQQRLPAALHNRVTSMVMRLSALVTMATVPDELGASIDVDPVSELLTMMTGGSHLDSTAPGLSSLVAFQVSIDPSMFDEPRIQGVHRVTDPPPRTKALKIVESSGLWSEWEIDDHLWRDVIRVYRSSVNLESPETKAVLELADLLITKGDPLEERLTALVEKVRATIKKMDEVIIGRVRQLWTTVASAIEREAWTDLLAPNCIDAAVQLQAYTRVLKEYYDAPEGAFVEAIYEGVDLCLRAPRLVVVGELGLGRPVFLNKPPVESRRPKTRMRSSCRSFVPSHRSSLFPNLFQDLYWTPP